MTPRGVLHPDEHEPIVDVATHEPSAPAVPFVEFYWHVRWHVQTPYDTKVLAHPNIHLVFEEPEPLVYGVDRGLFVRRLEETGQVLGIKFRPGGFRPFTDQPMSALADRRIPATEFFGEEILATSKAILSSKDLATPAEAFLLPRLPKTPDPVAQDVATMVDRMTTAPNLFRVDQAAGELNVSVRTLQRLFSEYVGASPKWVLRRARLHEAAARADQGTTIDWAALAADLGYSDQAHLTRDFTAAVGTPPATYARR
ncbi:AraC family transcriptional regulator [Actinomadura barringtoniae]|uniref:AraC family transcriptional regulator n=1 Tax=Actinomadura barringtoniae TaxID=1427535 RepID=A0A939P923_9ACTN|nr:helix-turn-helix domain-containing protein [Actinomadura barringtoniae]MBO2448332.1 AraC family transcriptional regulator [Actinomadura barringtoniae]